MKDRIIGVDIGGTSIKIGLFDCAGELLEQWMLPTNKSDLGRHVLEEIAHFIQTKVDSKRIYGVGFGVPGPVKADTVIAVVNIGWKNLNVKQAFLAHFPESDFIVKIANDANAAAAGELFKGAATGSEHVCLFTIGTGVGGGIIIDKQIFDGNTGVAGEFGHMQIDHTYQFPCTCGKTGCLETVASATGIVNLARYRLEHTNEPSPLREEPFLSAKKVIDYAKAGDVLAYETIVEVADYLARAMAIITHVINPDLFLLGGGVSKAGLFLLHMIETAYYPYVQNFVTKTKFSLAKLGNDAGIYGACYLVIQ